MSDSMDMKDFPAFSGRAFLMTFCLRVLKTWGLLAFLDIVFVWRVLNADLLVDLEVLGQPREF
jgi:hypothetical protein